MGDDLPNFSFPEDCFERRHRTPHWRAASGDRPKEVIVAGHTPPTGPSEIGRRRNQCNTGLAGAFATTAAATQDRTSSIGRTMVALRSLCEIYDAATSARDTQKYLGAARMTDPPVFTVAPARAQINSSALMSSSTKVTALA